QRWTREPDHHDAPVVVLDSHHLARHAPSLLEPPRARPLPSDLAGRVRRVRGATTVPMCVLAAR
ncbi:MAG TPA: hypothetical protein VGU73_01635, partial [Acidimicrobiia bacterium]|nr:hypothetical protein [Acidimicrobiia bacterium]